MKKALSESINSISPSTLSSIYPPEVLTPSLESLINRMLEQISVRTLAEFEQILESKGMNERLVKLESLILEAAASSGDGNSQFSSTNATNLVDLLPEGISPQDVLRFTMHKLKLQEQARLLQECEQVEAENDQIAREIELGKKQIEKKLESIEDKRRMMQKSADVCTMGSMAWIGLN